MKLLEQIINRRHVLIGATLLALSKTSAFAQAVSIKNPSLPDKQARDAIAWHHASSIIGTPKYPKDFTHFDYVNVDAPKAGLLRLAESGSFDTFNPILPKGEVATGLNLTYETLMTDALDERNISAHYGLIASATRYPDDKSWVSFKINPKARWHDGTPVTAEDVLWSFKTITATNPLYSQYYANVVDGAITGDNNDEVTFYFDTAGNNELPAIMGQLPILAKHWWEGIDAQGNKRDINDSTLEPIMGSGPYQIGEFEPGSFIKFNRVDDYWGKDLPVNIGAHNFDTIRYDYFGNIDAQIQALKSDDVDFREENSASKWKTAYEPEVFPALEEGFVKRETFPENASTTTQAFVPNLRLDKFKDWRVRRALNLAFDFETTNETVMHDLYYRSNSFFPGTALASSGLPEGKELELLEKYRGEIPETVFTQTFENPTGGSTAKMRANLKEAVRLLKEAGYGFKNRKMTHLETGETLDFELLDHGGATGKLELPWKANLAKIGIDMTYRVVETSTYINRIRSRDFDMIGYVWGQSLLPGNEQRGNWGSKAADKIGSRNFAGIRNPAIDAIIEEIVAAKNYDDLMVATHALDRVLLHNNYLILQLHYPFKRTVFWDRFGHPDPLPQHDIGFPTVWWWDEEKAARID